VVVVDDVYGGTQRYFRQIAAAQFGLQFDFVDLTVAGALDGACRENTKMVWVETPTNPTMKVLDIRAMATVARVRDLIFVVDNTFLGPYCQRPLKLGATISFNSVSKYINGHSDVIMGAIALNDRSLYDRLLYMQNALGGVPSPFDCYLALRGAKTLGLRMERHEANALKIADFLASHPMVTDVVYPGLKSHPQYDISARQSNCFGGMMALRVRGGLPEAKRFLESLTVIKLAESLGGVESLVEHPALMTHASVPPEDRAKLGIDDSLIRLSVGIENVTDLIQDLDFALKSVATAG